MNIRTRVLARLGSHRIAADCHELSGLDLEPLTDPARADALGRSGRELKAIRVTLSESHVARAWYEAPIA